MKNVSIGITTKQPVVKCTIAVLVVMDNVAVHTAMTAGNANTAKRLTRMNNPIRRVFFYLK